MAWDVGCALNRPSVVVVVGVGEEETQKKLPCNVKKAVERAKQQPDRTQSPSPPASVVVVVAVVAVQTGVMPPTSPQAGHTTASGSPTRVPT
jgi:hypothetical protein